MPDVGSQTTARQGRRGEGGWHSAKPEKGASLYRAVLILGTALHVIRIQTTKEAQIPLLPAMNRLAKMGENQNHDLPLSRSVLQAGRTNSRTTACLSILYGGQSSE